MTTDTQHGTELIPGLHLRHNPINKFAVLRLHYEADPDKNPATERGRQWFNTVREGKAENQWLREYEIDFLSHVGKRVCPDFDMNKHVLDTLAPHADFPLYRGWDPGIRASACVIGQIVEPEKGRPQVRIFHEYPFFEAAFQSLVKRVIGDSEDRYAKRRFWDDIDIAALQRGQARGAAPIDILGERGISPRHMKSKPTDRAILINHLLTSRTHDGQPCFLIHPRCHRLISGFRGLYRFKETKAGRATDKIDDTEIVHLFDAMGYMLYNNLHLKFKHAEREVEEKRQSIYLTEVMNAGKKKVKSWLNC